MGKLIVKSRERDALPLSAYVFAMALAGCASITGSKIQPVTVTATYDNKLVEDADCVLTNDKGTWYVKSPGSIVVQKSGGDMDISCKKDNIPPGSALVKSSANAGIWGNILFGGIIGYVVDG